MKKRTILRHIKFYIYQIEINIFFDMSVWKVFVLVFLFVPPLDNVSSSYEKLHKLK